MREGGRRLRFNALALGSPSFRSESLPFIPCSIPRIGLTLASWELSKIRRGRPEPTEDKGGGHGRVKGPLGSCGRSHVLTASSSRLRLLLCYVSSGSTREIRNATAGQDRMTERLSSILNALLPRVVTFQDLWSHRQSEKSSKTGSSRVRSPSFNQQKGSLRHGRVQRN